jgi:hypothetical protein
MIVTARQLEDLHRAGGANGHVMLPYRARLSPLAADWIRARKIVIGYGDVESARSNESTAGANKPDIAGRQTPGAQAESAAGLILWWCDGPCGSSKAAIMAQAKESSLRAMEIPSDAARLVPAIKALAIEVKAGRATGGILLVQSAAAAVVYANRCPSLRAVVGTCQEAVEQGIAAVAANVLVIEHPHKTLQQVKNMIARFARAKRELSEKARRDLQELASCA